MRSTLPSAPTTKTYGSVSSLNAVVASTGISWSVRVEHRLERPGRVSSSWYGSTLMNVTSGWAAATGLTLSRVGPQVARLAELRRREDRTNGFFAASASASDVS